MKCPCCGRLWYNLHSNLVSKTNFISNFTTSFGGERTNLRGHANFDFLLPIVLLRNDNKLPIMEIFYIFTTKLVKLHLNVLDVLLWLIMNICRNVCERIGVSRSNISLYQLGMKYCSKCAVYYRIGATRCFCCGCPLRCKSRAAKHMTTHARYWALTKHSIWKQTGIFLSHDFLPPLGFHYDLIGSSDLWSEGYFVSLCVCMFVCPYCSDRCLWASSLCLNWAPSAAACAWRLWLINSSFELNDIPRALHV